MSVVSKTVACDWPGCGAVQDVPRGALFRDYGWAENYDTNKHLCPAHRHKSWAELDFALHGEQELEDARERVRQLEQQLREVKKHDGRNPC